MGEPAMISPLSPYGLAFAAAAEQSAGAIMLCERPFATQLTLRLTPGSPAAGAAARVLGGALPSVPNSTVCHGGRDVLWMGPDEWLIVGRHDRESLRMALTAALSGEHAAVVDVSAQRTIIDVGGAAAREVLARGCALDLHPSSLHAGRCAQTMLARAQVILQPLTDPDGIRVLVRASFARYLAGWLLDACLEERAGAGRGVPGAHGAPIGVA